MLQHCGDWKALIMLAFVIVFGVFIFLMFYLWHTRSALFWATFAGQPAGGNHLPFNYRLGIDALEHGDSESFTCSLLLVIIL